MRFFGSILAAAAIASLASNVFLFVALAIFVDPRALTTIAPILAISLYSFLLSILVASTIGAVWHIIAQRNRWTQSVHYWIPALACGAAVGFLLWVPVAIYAGTADPGAWGVLLLLLAYGASVGGVTGYFSWRFRRPDLDGANPATSTP